MTDFMRPEKHRRKKHFVSKERGMATLVIAVILLTAITIIIFFSARTSIMEQRVASNDYRGKQAFEAAEAGVEYAIAEINRQTLFNLISSGSNVKLFWRNGHERTECSPPSSPCIVSLPGSDATATVELSLPKSGDLATIKVRSIGLSGDKTAKRTVTTLIRLSAILANPPPSPITSRRDVNLKDDIVINIPNDPDIYLIWSGGSVTPCCPPSSTAQGEVEQNSSSLHDVDMDDSEFFGSFFLSTKEQIKAYANTYGNALSGTNGPDYGSALNGTQGKIIWIDAEENSASITESVIGTSSEPVILIIENFNDLVLSDVHFHGLLYLAGPWDNGTALAYIKEINIKGMIIGEDTITLSDPASDPVIVDYDIDVIEALDKLGQYAKVAGSWRDFEVKDD